MCQKKFINTIKACISNIISKPQDSLSDDYVIVGNSSLLESIEIVEIIAELEEALERNDKIHLDLFVKVFECETVTIRTLAELIEECIK